MRDKLKHIPKGLIALLLTGGAFLFLMVFLVRNYTVTTDKLSAYIPETAIAHITLSDPVHSASRLLPTMEGRLAEVLQSVRLETDSSMSLFVYGIVDKKISWGLVTDARVDEFVLPKEYAVQNPAPGITILADGTLPDVQEGQKKTRHKLISKKLEGWGMVKERYRDLPVRLFLETDDAMRFVVGNRFLGLFPEKQDLQNEPPKLTFLPEHTALYLNDDNFSETLATLLDHLEEENIVLDTYLEDILAEIPGRTELLVRSVPDSEPGFTVVSTPQHGFKLDFNQFDRAIMNHIGSLDPKTVRITLADGTTSFERRSSFDEIEIQTHELSTGALYRTLSSHTGDYQIAYLIDHLGSIWLGNEPDIMQNLVLESTKGSFEDDTCSLNGSETTILINPAKAEELSSQNSELINLISGLRSLTFKLNDSETGLFTLCGYF